MMSILLSACTRGPGRATRVLWFGALRYALVGGVGCVWTLQAARVQNRARCCLALARGPVLERWFLDRIFGSDLVSAACGSIRSSFPFVPSPLQADRSDSPCARPTNWIV